MGNEVSRPANLSPQNSGVVPARSPYTPTGGSSRRAQSFNTRSPSPTAAPQAPPQRRTSSSSSLGSNPSSNPTSNPKKERTIQRMDKAIRRRVRGGITYNMKLLIRGAKGTGKTSLFHRLKGEPIPETHQSTPQLQSATINWSFRQNLEENVKCEVWDVVDKGFVPVEAGEEGTGSQNATGISAELGGLQSGGNLSANAATAAAAAAMQNGIHSVAIVDASTVDVYYEAHGVIFLLDVTKWDTLEYVKQQLDNVPVHIPTLVLGNFRDQGAQRKIFKEDIQELLYGSSDRPQHQQWRRPVELLYFECSLLNCYGLKSLHQYFGIPFLQLKLATIRQQIRIVEGEFAHLKHDVQATISEQRYVEYVEHIKATGSDIRTGRRGSGNGDTPPAVSRNNSIRLSPKQNSQTKPASHQAGSDDDVSVVSNETGSDTPPKQAISATTTATAATETLQQEQEIAKSQDMEDLPARTSSVVIQAAPPLMFEHKENVTSIPEDVVKHSATETEDKPAPSNGRSGDDRGVSNTSPHRSRKASVEEVMHLEDFQVPKARISDLDNFYSEDENDEYVGEYDEDVVVAPADRSKKASINGVYHKQRFLDSDSSDSDESEPPGTRRREEKTSRRSSPRRTATKQAITSGQGVPKPPQPSSPHPPTSNSRPKQKSQPESSVRSQSSSAEIESKDVPGEDSTQRHCSPPKDVVDELPATQSTDSSICHTSPRNKSAACAVEHVDSRLSLGESKEMNESPSGEEPELTGTESADQSIHRQESLDNSAKHANADEDASPYGSEKFAITPPMTNDKDVSSSVDSVDGNARPATSSASEGEPEDIVRVPAYNEEHNPVKNQVNGRWSDADVVASDEQKTFLEDGDDDKEDDDSALPQEKLTEAEADEASKLQPTTFPRHHPEVFVDTIDKNDLTEMSLSSLQAPLPIPQSSASTSVLSFAPELSASIGSKGTTHQGQDEVKGHYHKRNLDEAGDILSLSSLQASLPLPGEGSAPLPSNIPRGSEISLGYSDGGNDISTDAHALHLSDLQAMPVSSKIDAPDFATVLPSNDLEAFLNESGSDSDETSAPTHAEPAAQKKKVNRITMVESSDDENEEDQGRFASYSISKKKRSERRRQQKEELRQLNAALETDQPITPSTSGVAASESSFGTSDVMEAIRKAQEEAMRMLPTEPCPVGDDSDSSSSRKHKHKHKKEHKHKKREGEEVSKMKSSKKSNRKSGSSSRSKKRRPHVEDDVM